MLRPLEPSARMPITRATVLNAGGRRLRRQAWFLLSLVLLAPAGCRTFCPRSMEQNVRTALQLGYLDPPDGVLLPLDAVLRLPGESSGADNDVRLARARGIPVYASVEDVPGVVSV